MARTTNPPPPHASNADSIRIEENSDPLWKRVWHEIREDDVTGSAAKLAYYWFLALPPALMATFALAGMFGGETLANRLIEQARVALPSEVNTAIVEPFLQQILLDRAPGPFSIGLLLALWGGSTGVAVLMDAMNMAYDIEEGRPFVRKRAIALGIMLAGVTLFMLAAVAILGGPSIARAAGLGAVASAVWGIAQWPLAFLFMVAAFWIVYFVLPNRDQYDRRWVILRAAAGAALLWVAATAVFRVYIANFSSFTETYGFLGAFIIFLLWLYLTALVVIAGGEVASEMEKGA